MTTKEQIKTFKENALAINDRDAIAKKFVACLGSPKAATRHLVTYAVQAYEGGDTGNLAKMYDMSAKDKTAQRAIQALVACVWVGAKKTTDKKTGATIFKTSKKEGVKKDPNALNRAIKAVERGLTLRDTFIKEVRGEVKKKPITQQEVLTKTFAAFERLNDNAEKAASIDAMIAFLSTKREAIKQAQAEDTRTADVDIKAVKAA